MNKNILLTQRPYPLMVRYEDKALTDKVMAVNRREAVHKALSWFWKTYQGSRGPAHKALIVDDPYNEVHYGPRFICSDRMNKLLSDSVIARLIRESKGELMRDTRKGSPHNQPNSLRRVNRRRDFGKYIAPGIKRMKNGLMYYHVQTKPQRVEHGRVLEKKEYRDVRLGARTLEGVLAEIEARGLRSQNVHKYKMKARDIPFTKYVCGLADKLDPVYMRKLSARDRKRVRVLLKRYEKPKQKEPRPQSLS